MRSPLYANMSVDTMAVKFFSSYNHKFADFKDNIICIKKSFLINRILGITK